MRTSRGIVRKALLITALHWLAAAGLLAQSRQDSLLRAWQDVSKADTLRLQAVQSLIWSGIMNTYPDSAMALANGQLKLARQKSNRKWEGKALYNIGTCLFWQSEFAKAFSYFEQSLDIRKAMGDKKGEAAIYGNFGLVYNEQGNNLKALDYLTKSLDINLAIKDTANITSNYNNLAIIYQEQSNYEKALFYYEEALKLYDPVKDRDEVALTYNNIGNAYGNMDKPQKALEYLYKSLAIRTELDDRLGMAINYTNLGSNYSKIARYDSALIFIKKGAALFEVLGDKSGSSNACAILGDISFQQKQYKSSLVWCNRALKLGEEMGKVPMQRIACHCLYQSYKAMGNMGKALEFHEKYKLFGDSLKKAEIEVRLHQMEFDKEILTDSLLREEEKHLIRMGYQADLNKKTQVRNVILVVSIGILLLALVFLSRMLYFQKRSENFQLETQKLEKQQLINEVALLRTQVNPHFLFNSLSILSSLVHINADLSEQFIDQLSRSYRYILEQKDQTVVTLRTELEFIRSYAFLLKIRFENKFDLRIQLAESDLDAYKIAPLTLQLLVENAVKHNRMSAAEPLVVEVLREGDFLLIKNRVQLRPQREESTRMGLQNIINRYALITDRCVWAGEQDGAFVVKVPLLSCQIS